MVEVNAIQENVRSKNLANLLYDVYERLFFKQAATFYDTK